MQKDKKIEPINDDKKLLKETAVAAVSAASNGIYNLSIKEAEHYKTLSILYFAGFLSFVLIMLVIGYALFVYEASNFVLQDGTTMWGIIATKSLIFVPLIILAWFFAHEAIKSRERYEIAIHIAFFISVTSELVETKDRAELFKEIIGIVKSHS